MSIWDEPDAIKPHPLLAPPRVEIRTLADALKLLDQWQAAYDELRTDYARMHDAYCKMKWRAEHAEALAANFEFLYEHTGGARELRDDHKQ